MPRSDWIFDEPGTVGYNQDTLVKVADAIRAARVPLGRTPIGIAMQIINSMQNEGILFRERVE